MPYSELLKWVNYFKIRPIGWREDYRTFLQMTSISGSKEKPENIFPSIKAVLNSDKDKEKAPLPKGLWLEKMMAAKGGDHKWKPFWETDDDKSSNNES